MTKNVTIRVGDRVTLTDPRPIIKIGYERDIDTIFQEVKNDTRILTFCIDLQLRERDEESVIKAVSRSVLSRGLRSGIQRKIFYSEIREDLRNRPFYVVSKHIRKTGNYYGPSGYEGEYDYDPGGLCNERTHIILGLSEHQYCIENLSCLDYNAGLYVSSTQVEKVKLKGRL